MLDLFRHKLFLPANYPSLPLTEIFAKFTLFECIPKNFAFDM